MHFIWNLSFKKPEWSRLDPTASADISGGLWCVCASAYMQDLFQVSSSARILGFCCDDSLYIFSDFHLGIWNCFAEVEYDYLLTCLCSYSFIYVCI